MGCKQVFKQCLRIAAIHAVGSDPLSVFSKIVGKLYFKVKIRKYGRENS